MALIFRLTGRRLLWQENGGPLRLLRPVTLKAKTAEAPKDEGHDERNMRLGRPQSPHLTIYAPQLTSVLSISHRMTGLVLTGYAMALGLGAVVLPETIPHYIESLECARIGPVGMATLKFFFAFPFTYHFWNGIRHLIWDTGKLLTIPQVYATGYVMLLLAIASAGGLSVM